MIHYILLVTEIYKTNPSEKCDGILYVGIMGCLFLNIVIEIKNCEKKTLNVLLLQFFFTQFVKVRTINFKKSLKIIYNVCIY